MANKPTIEKSIILLNGPSSSGKSTLSLSLQKALIQKKKLDFAVISIDNFMKIAEDETIYEDDVFEISQDMCDETVKALENHDGVIVDHVITSERIFLQFMAMANSYSLMLVHVSCPLDILKERERSRGNRCLGSAEASFEYLYPKDGYDLTIDTDAMSADECASKILEKLN